MFLAVFGDVHGNLPALEAVVEAIDNRGIHTVCNTGDCAVGYPWPNEVIALLRDRAVISVQGETDRLAVRVARKAAALQRRLDEDRFRAVQWTHDHLAVRNIEYLRDLPLQRTLRVEGIDIALFHGLPTTQAETLHGDDDAMRFQRVRESVNVPLVLCGKSHVPYAREVDDTLFVNPGSVGVTSGDGSRTRFAIVDTDAAPWKVEVLTIPYDGDRAEKALREQGLPAPPRYLG